ncbi:hypothetical protein [Paracoccus spongiarum]|uniref:Uncharacterized protein n=1 Tax=Paracoccus spongiarum TaxID=3064387 RepID=A0ABT9JBX8_9RHOB|nr:hypothetical protein [Paracoccus sp. 2205BS29-5]MDP5307220.1 hypothetical protein [Paracoccus sp. 2205BS29-5]
MAGVGIELLGVIAVGIGAAALLFALMHASRKAGLSLPRWLLPAGIGLAMIGYAIWNDYSWYGRAVARLPAQSQVLMVGQGSQPWAPWTYLAPVTLRFAALDPATVRAGEAGVRQAQIMLVERRGPTLVVPQDFDCGRGMIRPARGDWTEAAPDDPALAAVCREEGDDGRDSGDRG